MTTFNALMSTFTAGDLAQRLQHLRGLVLIEFLPALVSAKRGHQVGNGDVNRLKQTIIAE